MQLYSADTIAQLRMQRKSALLRAILPTVALLVVCVVLCFFVNDNNSTLLQITNTVVTVLSLWYLVAMLCVVVSPLNKRLKLVTKLLVAPTVSYVGVANVIDGTITLANGIAVQQIGINDKVVYWEVALGEFSYDNSLVNVVCANNFVVGCEVCREK